MSGCQGSGLRVCLPSPELDAGRGRASVEVELIPNAAPPAPNPTYQASQAAMLKHHARNQFYTICLGRHVNW